MHYKNSFWFLIFIFIMLLLLLLDIILGSVYIPFEDILHILFYHQHDNNGWVNIIYKVRIPKAFTAVLAGSALAISGLQMQTLFQNPLAGPSVLGITSGAGLGVAFVMLGTGNTTSIAAIQHFGFLGGWLMVAASILGSALVLILVLSISYRVNDNVILLIIGMMIAGITNSLVAVWQYFSQPEQIQDYLIWTFGSLGGVTQEQLWVLGIMTGLGLFIAFLSSKYLNILLLGENYAKSMGLSISKARWIIIGSTSILTGAVTAFCGPIGFVGIAVPHLTRSFLNTTDHRILIPANFLIGGILLLFCDIIAHLPHSQSVLPINAMTSLIGAPVVIWVILKGNNLRNSF